MSDPNDGLYAFIGLIVMAAGAVLFVSVIRVLWAVADHLSR